MVFGAKKFQPPESRANVWVLSVETQPFRLAGETPAYLAGETPAYLAGETPALRWHGACRAFGLVPSWVRSSSFVTSAPKLRFAYPGPA